jgi:outer membrane protein, heavy metal efflux system
MKKLSILIIFLLYQAAYGQTATITELQNIALSENPRIKAMESEARMVKRRIPQSDALEDPKLKAGVNWLSAKNLSYPKQYITSRDLDPSQVTFGKGYLDIIPYAEFGISQMIPLGKLGFRRKIAVKEYDKAATKFKAEKVETLHMLRMNFYELTYLRSSIKILEDIKKQIKLVIDSEVAAAKSGTGSLSNVMKGKIEHNMAEEETIVLKQKQKEAEQRINYLAGKNIEIKTDKLPEPDSRPMSSEAVQKEIIASNPQLKLLALDLEISKSEISLKKAEYVPDVEIGFSYMRQWNGAKQKMNETMFGADGTMTPVYRTERMKQDDMINFMVTFNIPFWFWKKNIPMVDEMKKKHDAAKNFYQDKLNDTAARGEILLSNLTKWRDLHRLYRDRLIPQTQLALETNLARYRTSSVEFMQVVDNVRMLLKYKKELLMATKEYHATFSELSALMGVEVLQ